MFSNYNSVHWKMYFPSTHIITIGNFKFYLGLHSWLIKLQTLSIYMLYQLIHQLLKTGLFKNILESFQQRTGSRDDCHPLKLNFLPRLLLLRLIVIENLCNAHVSSLIHAYRYLWTWNKTVLLWPLGFFDLPIKCLLIPWFWKVFNEFPFGRLVWVV